MSNNAKITTQKSDAKPALTPKLRFPDFRDAEAWKERQLENVAPLQRGFDLPSDLIRPGKIPIVYSNGIQKYHEVGMATAPGLVTGRSGTIGKLHFVDEGEYWPHNTSLWVTDFKGNVPRFIYYLYDLIGMSRFSSGSGVPTLNRNDVHAFRFPVPESTAEQQKIADCLTSVDKLITAQARNVAALKAHKKGLMQELLPRPERSENGVTISAETRPRLRFPEFQNAGEWASKPMGMLLSGSPDYGVNAAAVPFSENLPKYLRITDISEDNRYLPDRQVSVDLDATDENYLDEGDIVLARTGASVGKSYRYRKVDGRLVFAGFLIRIRPNPRSLNPTYLANFLTSDQFWKWVEVTSARSGQPGINSTEYSALAIPLPPDLSEQKRIADCLTSLDDLIAAQTQKLDALKTHKKGLMQQLFPSPEEVEA
ncbi:restriction endonuclease subunit S [Rhizobium ruizarguesonis]